MVRKSWVRIGVCCQSWRRLLLLLICVRAQPSNGSYPGQVSQHARSSSSRSYLYPNVLPVNEQTALTVSRLVMMIIDFNPSSSFLSLLREPSVSTAGGAGLNKRYEALGAAAELRAALGLGQWLHSPSHCTRGLASFWGHPESCMLKPACEGLGAAAAGPGGMGQSLCWRWLMLPSTSIRHTAGAEPPCRRDVSGARAAVSVSCPCVLMLLSVCLCSVQLLGKPVEGNLPLPQWHQPQVLP